MNGDSVCQKSAVVGVVGYEWCRDWRRRLTDCPVRWWWRWRRRVAGGRWMLSDDDDDDDDDGNGIADNRNGYEEEFSALSSVSETAKHLNISGHHTCHKFRFLCFFCLLIYSLPVCPPFLFLWMFPTLAFLLSI